MRNENLRRLLQPRHVAVIGGRDADTVIGEMRRIGFDGPIWPVNPNRESIRGITCYQSVNDLPAPPDATFVAVPASAAIDVVSQLAQLGAGGVVCYTAGFGGVGVEGGDADQGLVDAAGDLAIVGPNCYGVINFIEKVALWPFAQSGFYPGYGAAVITQSGMLSSDIIMSQRSLPLAYMISAGNQSILRLEDYVEALCERDEVRAFGLHIEGIKDIPGFVRAAYLALENNKPIVVLKTGTSKVGEALTISHTGSLSGNNELYQALFDRLGIISVDNPSQLIETLKFLCVSGEVHGNKLMGFTCSGGGATMVADYAEKIDLAITQPSQTISVELKRYLPEIATVSNPLDYTTPIWGMAEKTYPVFSTALKDDYDAAILIQDYPAPLLNDGKEYYTNDAGAFTQAVLENDIPGAVCSTLPENMDQDTRQLLINNGIAPLQGIHEGLNAIRSAFDFSAARRIVLNEAKLEITPMAGLQEGTQVDEWTAKNMLREAGLEVPSNHLVGVDNAIEAAEKIGYPVVLKMNSAQLAHKTEAGAVVLNVETSRELTAAMSQMQAAVSTHNSSIATDQFLIEAMADNPVVELMMSIRYDSLFGWVMTVSCGGILIELLNDSDTLILPTSKSQIVAAIKKLRVAKLMQGYRGGVTVDMDMLATTINRIAVFTMNSDNNIFELEINPLFVYSDHVTIIDALMHQRRTS